MNQNERQRIKNLMSRDSIMQTMTDFAEEVVKGEDVSELAIANKTGLSEFQCIAALTRLRALGVVDFLYNAKTHTYCFMATSKKTRSFEGVK